jgi:hypothetical protein
MTQVNASFISHLPWPLRLPFGATLGQFVFNEGRINVTSPLLNSFLTAALRQRAGSSSITSNWDSKCGLGMIRRQRFGPIRST